MKTIHKILLTGINMALCVCLGNATVVHSGKSITIVQPLDACSSIQEQNGSINTGSARAIIVDSYFDALGHKSIAVLRKGATDSKDLLTDYSCDFAGKVTRISKPLPVYPSSTILKEDLPSALTTYYNDNAPFTSYTYENTGGHLILAVTQSGNTYQSHPTIYSYRANTNAEVAVWEVTENGIQRSGFYPEGSLAVTTKTDSEGAYITIFRDASGKIIMRQQGGVKTYFVYDTFERLRYILPPAVSGHLGDGTYSEATERIRLYGYIYRYDRKGNLVMKRLPGCDSIAYEYNTRNQLIYSQDGNQRQRGDYWLHLEYDDWGRKTAISEVNRSDGSYLKLLQQFYYDDYSAVQTLTQSQQNNLAFTTKSGYDNSYASATGLPTMTITYGLTSTVQDIEVLYYDYKGRCIQKQQIAPTFGHKSFFYTYNFDGTLSKQWAEQSVCGEGYTYSYDRLGRPTTTQYRFDDETMTQSVCIYNERGQLFTKHFHNGDLIQTDSFDIRGNLTKRAVNGFTERLYYADNLPSGASPHYNGLISASKVTQGNDEVTFFYLYDNQNRLTEAYYGKRWQEYFQYDEMGNISSMLRGTEEEPIDGLYYSYKGNQIVGIEDIYGNQNMYNTKEYVDASNVDTTMIYDKNGTIIVDLDRNICAIRNNLLNLPDTVQFRNGNQIINSYDAMGRKRSTTYRTLTTPTVVPVGSVINLPSNNYTSRTIYYSGNIELTSIPPGITEWTAHTPVGYVKANDVSDDPCFYYYVHDHLGNVCAVWSAETNSFVQKTFYYPSGVPMNISTNQAAQPNKYNGKPYEEMHGFDIYEYETRGYYASIMRFTAMDPLCEQTPWQSPYVYAANNPICNVDWMGLYPGSFSSRSYGTYNMTIIDSNGNVLYHIDNDDTRVYLFDGDNFDETNIDYSTLLLIGFELPYVQYKMNQPCLFRRVFVEGGNGYADPIFYSVIYYGNRPATAAEIYNWISDIPKSSLESVLEYVIGFTSDYLPGSYGDYVKRGGVIVSGLYIVKDIYNIYKGKNVIDSSVDIPIESLSIISTCLTNPALLLAALTIDMYYKGGKKIAETVSNINTTRNSSEYVYDWFGWNYMMY